MFPAYKEYFVLSGADIQALAVVIALLILIGVFQYFWDGFIKRKVISSKKAIFFRVIFIIGSIGLFFLLLEVVAIHTEKQINQSLNTHYEIDFLLFWKPRTGQSTIVNGDTLVNIDSKGIRTLQEIPYKKEKNELRILFLGDSWTYGMGLKNEQTYAHRLQEILQQKYPHRKITSINAGCFAYCLAQSLIYLKHRGYRYEPDIVVVKNSFNRRTLSAFKKIYPLPYSKILESARSFLWRSYAYNYARRIFYIASNKKPKAGIKYRESVKPYEKLVYNEIIAETKKMGAKPVFLYLDFHPRNQKDILMKEAALEREALFVEVMLHKSADPEFHLNHPDHPGPNNAERIAEKLCESMDIMGIINKD